MTIHCNNYNSLFERTPLSMVLHITLIALFVSISIHILVLVLYLLKKTNLYIILFLATAFSNIFIGMILSVLAFRKPELVRNINMQLFVWHISGYVSVFMLGIKVSILCKILKRRANPDMYHVNYFGKKVFNEKFVKKSELNAILLSMPFFLFSGAYFVVKLIRSL